MGVNKIINSPVVNKLKICDLKSSRFLKYTAIIIITITTRVILYMIIKTIICIDTEIIQSIRFFNIIIQLTVSWTY